MPHDPSASNPMIPPPRGTTKCPWGRDCPWDWPRLIPMSTRWKWALEAIWFALSGQHPKEPRVFHAALSHSDLLQSSVLDSRAREILNTINYYERELQAFRGGGRQ